MTDIAKPRLNILWILSDQHHAECMGHAGRSQVRTPNLDALAAEGVRFTRAYANSPICGPSRCSMISGQYPHTTGITGNRIHALEIDPPATLPIVLRNAGYETMMVGKAHMIRRWNEAGFEHRHYCDLADSDDGDPRNVGYFQTLIDEGRADEFDMGSRRSDQPGHNLEGWISTLPERLSVEAWTGDRALELLQKRDRTRPFMMQLSFQRPHEPLCIPPERANEYDPETIALPRSVADFFEHGFAGKPDYQKNYVKQPRGAGYPYRPRDRADLQRQVARYYTLITMIDHQIGRVIEHLRQSGDLGNTVILYTADHGDFAGDHGLHLKNLGIYESIHHVPFLLSWPGGPRGAVCHEMIELVDIYPTLLDAAGVNELKPQTVQGRSVLPIVRGEQSGLDVTVCEFDFHGHQPVVLAARDRRFRLVFYPTQSGVGELYDHESDPDELHNVWGDTAYREQRLRLTEAVLRHVACFRRVYAFSDDQKPFTPKLSQLVQQKGVPWSRASQSISPKTTN